MTSQSVVVITGSTRGLGRGMAEAFVARGCAVVVNGRDAAAVETAVAELYAGHPGALVVGVAADLAEADQAQLLWDAAVAALGRVDIWINNAALHNPRVPFWELEPQALEAVVRVNLLGTMQGCRVAIRGMLAQGGGRLYTLEGFGSEGRMHPGVTPYGTTKAAVAYLTKALVKETSGTAVQVGTINPGMVLTDMLLDNLPTEHFEQVKRFYNILADRVEDVAPWLVERILADRRSGTRLCWLTNRMIFWRFLSSRWRKRDLLSQVGATPGRQGD